MLKQYLFPLKGLILLFLLVPIMAHAQKDTSKIPIPVKNRLVNYVQACTYSSPQNQTVVFNRAVKWVSGNLKGSEQGIKTKDAASGKITATGMFKIITSDSGNYYWLRFNVLITVSDGACVLSLLNYYEKPIEKGISNEYSKIEYRWGDFRRGKPWSAEDEKLFEGLNSNSQALMESFKKAMEQ
ncbi:MAG: DUF4468 domain-containing protein [Bacteroidota bacterium]